MSKQAANGRSLTKIIELKNILKCTPTTGLSPEVKQLISDTVWKLEDIQKKLMRARSKSKSIELQRVARSKSKKRHSSKHRSQSRSRSISLPIRSMLERKLSTQRLQRLNKKLDKIVKSKSKSRTPPKQPKPASRPRNPSKKLPAISTKHPKDHSAEKENLTSAKLNSNISAHSNTSTRPSNNHRPIALKPHTSTTTANKQHSQSIKLADLDLKTRRTKTKTPEKPLKPPQSRTQSKSKREQANKKHKKDALRKEIGQLDQEIYSIESKISEEIRGIQKKLRDKLTRQQQALPDLNKL